MFEVVYYSVVTVGCGIAYVIGHGLDRKRARLPPLDNWPPEPNNLREQAEMMARAQSMMFQLSGQGCSRVLNVKHRHLIWTVSEIVQQRVKGQDMEVRRAWRFWRRRAVVDHIYTLFRQWETEDHARCAECRAAHAAVLSIVEKAS